MAILFLCDEFIVVLLLFVFVLLPPVLLVSILLFLLLAEEGLAKRLLVLLFVFIALDVETALLCNFIFSSCGAEFDNLAFLLVWFLVYVLSNASTDITCASSRSHSPTSFTCYRHF